LNRASSATPGQASISLIRKPQITCAAGSSTGRRQSDEGALLHRLRVDRGADNVQSLNAMAKNHLLLDDEDDDELEAISELLDCTLVSLST